MTDKEILDLYFNQNYSAKQIAEKFGTYSSKIQRIIKKNGFKLRPLKQGGVKCGKYNHNWTGYEDITGSFWRNIITHARTREITFSLTMEHLWNLFIQQNKKCAISGVDIYLPVTQDDFNKGNYTASVDRIDSQGDYCNNNVQWVHKTVNRLKWNLDQTEFINWCKIISNNWKT